MAQKVLLRALATLFVAALILGAAIAELYDFFAKFFPESWMGAAAANALLAIVVLLRWKSFRANWQALDSHNIELLRAKFFRIFRNPRWTPYLPAVIVVAGTLLLIGISRSIGDPGTTQFDRQFWTHQFIWILLIPPVEELVFRVGIGGYFRKIGGNLWGSYFSATFFSYVHSWPTVARLLSGDVGAPLGPLLLAIVAEACYVLFGRVGPIIALHVACNATAVVFALFDSRWLSWLDFLYL